MKLTTPLHHSQSKIQRDGFEMDLIRDAISRRKLATERLHEDYRKMYKSHQFVH